MKKLKGKFVAAGDDGKNYVINMYVDVIKAGTHDDLNGEIEGLKSLLTSDGLQVNYISKGEYKIAVTGIHLHSQSPDAP